ncbi:alpha/beta-hydrolase [Pluteus cervinus]|uniref:Alpha/beta-hydrolase n=1 Tax=Pluteus cervinus TaxID=181527 RepID=A0ACD3AC58_9AGAR|nr:alpha/beta-hydrolase [Pluteus cervinus]
MLANLLLLTSFLSFASSITLPPNRLRPTTLSFPSHHELEDPTSHILGGSQFPDLSSQSPLLSDTRKSSILREAVVNVPPTGVIPTLKARPTTVYRPKSLEAHHQARLRSLRHQETIPIKWDELEVLGPDIEDRHTLVQLARMSGNAYALPGQRNWYEIDPVWNQSFPVGWDGDADGFRGHVFLSSDNSTVVLSIKGTTVQGPTSKKDKFNDNLLFSCCCARVDLSWIFRTVCDCYARNWRCDNTCLSEALIEESLFYSIGMKLVSDIIHLYPEANLWLVGHSLGGALASLLGSTYGLPAVAFESPGEKLAAERLHLPLPRPPSPPPDGDLPVGKFKPKPEPNPKPKLPPVAVTHVYHTADPIPQGACTGIASPCAQGGYALETRCHLGKTIVYDTVERLGWYPDVRTHIIKDVIHRLLELEDIDWGDGRDVPLAQEEEDCVDCWKWEFGEFKDHLSL